jgi:hypothetical protein
MSRKKVHNHYQEHITAIMEARGVSLEEARQIYEDAELDPAKLANLIPK